VELGPEAGWVSFGAAAALGAGRSPFTLAGFDVSSPVADGADGLAHLLLQGGGHLLLGVDGEVYAGDVT